MKKQTVLAMALASLLAAAISGSCREGGHNDDDETRDVYVAGYEREGKEKYIVKIWKNGRVLQTFTNDIIVKSISVSGSDVYMAGYGNAVATVWKNGRMLYTLPNGSEIDDIFVSGSDVYVAGKEWGNDSSAGKVWKNGQIVHMFPDTNIFSIFVK
jgi:hypothetical protein